MSAEQAAEVAEEIQEIQAETEAEQATEAKPEEESGDGDADEQAAFNAVFSGEEAKDTDTDDSQEAKQGEEAGTTTEPQEEVVAGMPVSQLKAALARLSELDRLNAELQSTRDKLSGQIGVLHQKIGQRGRLEVNPDHFAKLREEFGDELADAQQELLTKILSGFVPETPSEQETNKPAAKEPAEDAQQIESRMTQRMETRVLDLTMPDWRQTVNSADFRLWQQTLPSEVRQQIDTSWDAQFLHGQLSTFKQWSADQKKQAEARKRRLQAAVSPRGVPPNQSAIDAEREAFEAVFRQT